MRRLPTEYIKTRKEYIIFKNDCGVSDMTRKGGIYEHYIFDYIRDNVDIKGKTIIDVGANFGFHTLEFADLVDVEEELKKLNEEDPTRSMMASLLTQQYFQRAASLALTIEEEFQKAGRKK